MIQYFVALVGFSLLAPGFSKGGYCETSEELEYVLCRGNFSQESSLKKAIEAFETPFRTFYLIDAQLDTLPPDIFSNLETAATVNTVIFDRVTVKLFHVPILGMSPFYSLRYTLEDFEIYASDGLFAWNWSSFSELRKLRTLIIEDCKMYSVPVSFGSAPNLRLVQFSNAEIYHLEDWVFRKAHMLTFFSASGNYLKVLKRSWFPDPAEKLWSIDLSHNELHSLGHDVFTNMPALHEVKMDHNRLKYVTEGAMAPVWSNLNELWLHGNDLACESLCWIKSSKDNPMFLSDAYCREDRKQPKLLLITYLDKCK